MRQYTFTELFSGQIDIGENQILQFEKIEIPMIQRDYAQGRGTRKDKEIQLNETGAAFLEAIFEALLNDTGMELDFIYGAIQRQGFIPLDGQQRLTTLFLLYWYIGSRELPAPEAQNLMKELGKFTYSTRTSSRRFCEQLCATGISFATPPSQELSDQSWFYQSYQKDPTVKAMLNMLDAIHEQYSSGPLFERLAKLRFYILPLDGFKLTEELYIKMNARGKQLTDFENFKADLTKSMRSVEDLQTEVRLITGREVPYHLLFSQKMDNEWANIFWQKTRAADGAEKALDPLFMRFFIRYSYHCRIMSLDDGKLDAEKAAQDVQARALYGRGNDDSDFHYHSWSRFHEILRPDAIRQIEKFLDTLCKHEDELMRGLNPGWDTEAPWMLYGPKISQKQRIALSAAILYVEQEGDFEAASYRDWMRFAWNIIADPTIRQADAMVRAMWFMKDMAQNSHNILKHLETDPPSSVFTEQLKEECVKAKLIAKDQVWKDEIIKAEHHSIFMGNIRFLLPDDEETDRPEFMARRDIAFRIIKKEYEYLWPRAALAQVKPEEPLSLPLTLANGQFAHWRTLINSEKFLIKPFRMLLERLCGEEDLAAAMKDICVNYSAPDELYWLEPLIKKSLLEHSESQKIQQYDEQIYLYNKNNWTEGNIQLTTRRNDIIAQLLARSDVSFLGTDWQNIDETFFRGWNVALERRLAVDGGTVSFEYFFERNKLTIGIRNYDEINGKGRWLYNKSYDYSGVGRTDSALEEFFNLAEDAIQDFDSWHACLVAIKPPEQLETNDKNLTAQ